MQKAAEFTELLLDELVSYYGPEEPVSIIDADVRATHLDKMARHSARRLAARLSESDIAEFTRWFSQLRQAPDDPFFDELENQTQMTWRDEDGWPAFQELSGRLVELMQERTPASR